MAIFPPRMTGLRTSSRRRPNGWACSDCGTVRSLWNCPNAGEYPAYIEWRGTHKVVEGARERFRALARDEILSRIERTQAELDRLVAEYKAM